MKQEPCTHTHWVQLKPRKVSTAFTTYSCKHVGDCTTHLPATAVSRDSCLSMGAATGSKPSHRHEAEHSGKAVWLGNSVCVLQRALAGHWASARTPVLMSWKTPRGPRQRHPWYLLLWEFVKYLRTKPILRTYTHHPQLRINSPWPWPALTHSANLWACPWPVCPGLRKKEQEAEMKTWKGVCQKCMHGFVLKVLCCTATQKAPTVHCLRVLQYFQTPRTALSTQRNGDICSTGGRNLTSFTK